MPYRSLDSGKIIATIERLKARIEERFPSRGIVSVCDELLQIANEDASRADQLSRPNLWLRAAILLIIAGFIAAMSYGVWIWRVPAVEEEAFHAFQGIEAIVNLAVLSAAGVWFLLNVEARIRRTRILEDLHELRSIAHVIDMHQLTKDPTRSASAGKATRSSPAHDMSPFELSRYLDYCAEMLSLTGKLAAMYLRSSRDALVIDTVNEIEDLTANLTRKIWQKIMILHQGRVPGDDEPASQAADPSREPVVLSTGQATANATCSPLHPFALGEDELS